MPKREYVSTGEAARILSISRSTVSRRFDLGVLQGKVNPITGERLILKSSLRAFLEQHDLPVDETLGPRKVVLLAAGDRKLCSVVEDIAAAEQRLDLLKTDRGSDALVSCLSDAPDLLILGEGLPDVIPCSVVQSLRRREEHRSLRIMCCLDSATAEECLKWGADAALNSREWQDPGLIRSRLLDVLGISGQATAAEEHSHRRRWTRFAVHLSARAGIYRVGAPRHHNWGEAVVTDISEGGVFLGRINFEDGAIPTAPFRILLNIDEKPLLDWHAYCQVVRLQGNGSLTAGLQFVRISDADRLKITALAGAA